MSTTRLPAVCVVVANAGWYTPSGILTPWYTPQPPEGIWDQACTPLVDNVLLKH